MIEQSPHVQLAMAAIREYVELGSMLRLAADLPEDLAQPAASFVSLKKGAELRGCIGTIEPTQPTLAEEILINAISAATRDPRFPPVEPKELDFLACSVDVLSPPEEIPDEGMLDPIRYGVIVQCESRRGLLLPNLEGVDTVELQLDIARRKGFIPLDEKVRLFRFEVKRFY